MHNSSDIFCFKEPKTGESDGSEIYAVDGSCFSSCFAKNNKRHHLTSEAFQFANANQQGKKKEIGEIVGEEDLDELCELARIETQQPMVSRSNMKRSLITGVGLEDEKVSQKRHFKAAYNEHSNGLFNLNDTDIEEVKVEDADEACEDVTQNGDVTDAGFVEDEELVQENDCNENDVDISSIKSETEDPEKRTVTIARNFLTGEGLEDDVRLSQRKHFEAVDIDDSDQTSDTEDSSFAKVNDVKAPDGLSSPSSIKRNFLTGTGLEDQKVSQRKHCPQKADKWLW